MFWSDKTDVFVATNSSQAAKWFRCFIALHFSSFCFTDPPALDAGTWPKQLHSNNLEHLNLEHKLNTNFLKLNLCACVSVCVCNSRELRHAV